MAYTTTDLVAGIRATRIFFWKHLEGVKDDQWDWKPYSECKSLRETLAHLLVDDRAALYALETGKEPDYEAFSGAEQERDLDILRAQLAESHDKVCAYLMEHYGSLPIETEACIYGEKMPLARGLGLISWEDAYHAGQVAFIRMASDPTWNYYADIYGFTG